MVLIKSKLCTSATIVMNAAVSIVYIVIFKQLRDGLLEAFS